MKGESRFASQRWLALAAATMFLTLLAAGCQDDSQPAKPVPASAKKVVKTAKTPQSSSGQQSTFGTAADQTNAGAQTPNSPPKVVKITFSPEFAVPDSTVRAEVEIDDPDQILVSLEYEWRVNGERDSRTELEEFDTTGLAKGDRVTVVVTPFDGQAKGAPAVSSILVLQNRPPNILTFPPVGLTDGKFVYQVKAEDPDGDPLTYELEEAPPGMDVDPETGLIEWTIPPEAIGSYAPRLLVSDGDAKAFQIFSLTVTRVQ